MTDKRTKAKKKDRDWARLRLAVVALVFFLALAGVIGRAFDLQVVQHERLAGLARQEYEKTVTLVPSRGLILDRHGSRLAATVPVDSVYARPRLITDKKLAARKLSPILGIGSRHLLRALGSAQPFVWLKRRVEPETAAKVNGLRLAGLGVVPESRRFYPQLELAAHLIGFAGLDAQGLEGLEKRYDKLLKGSVSRVVRTRDARGKSIFGTGASVQSPADDGCNLVLTIDKGIQFLTEEALARAVADSGAKGGLAVVMEVETGRILASAVLPTFNPNIFTRYPRSTWRNRVLTDPIEPGSVMKAFTLAVALEQGLYSPDTIINCEGGQARFGGRTVHDHHPHDEISLADVLRYSSNIGAAKIGLALGAEKLRAGLSRFGFGRKLDIDLPAESSGLLRPADDWRTIDTANIAFGQGVAATALQVTSAMASLANQGVLMRPYVVGSVVDAEGRLVSRTRPLALGRSVSPATARTMVGLLERVVAEGGTGTKARTPGYLVAGKTGTSQKLDPATGRYSKKNYLAVFSGFAPVKRPAIAVTVIVDEPRTSIYGGQVAAPAFSEIVRGALPLLGVPASRPDLPAATVEAKSKTGGVIDLGRAASTRAKLDRPASADRVMPDLAGLSLRQALAKLAVLGLSPEVTGSGYVVEQHPGPGQPIDGVHKCRLKLEADV